MGVTTSGILFVEEKSSNDSRLSSSSMLDVAVTNDCSLFNVPISFFMSSTSFLSSLIIFLHPTQNEKG